MAAHQREAPSTGLRTEASSLKQSQSAPVSSAPGQCGAGQDCAEGTAGGSEGVKKSEETQVADQKEGSCQRSDPSPSLGPKPVGSGSSIIVSPRQVCIKLYMAHWNSLHIFQAHYIFVLLLQRGNPILKFVRSVPWEFGDVVPDYVLGQTTCALFLR